MRYITSHDSDEYSTRGKERTVSLVTSTKVRGASSPTPPPFHLIRGAHSLSGPQLRPCPDLTGTLLPPPAQWSYNVFLAELVQWATNTPR